MQRKSFLIVTVFSLCAIAGIGTFFVIRGPGSRSDRDIAREAVKQLPLLQKQQKFKEAIELATKTRQSVNLDSVDPMDAGMLALAESFGYAYGPPEGKHRLLPTLDEAEKAFEKAQNAIMVKRVYCNQFVAAFDLGVLNSTHVKNAKESCLNILGWLDDNGFKSKIGDDLVKDFFPVMQRLTDYLGQPSRRTELLEYARLVRPYITSQRAAHLITAPRFAAVVSVAATANGETSVACEWAELGMDNLVAQGPDVQLQSHFVYGNAMGSVDPQSVLEETKRYCETFSKIESPTEFDREMLAYTMASRVIAQLILQRKEQALSEIERLEARVNDRLGAKAKSLVAFVRQAILTQKLDSQALFLQASMAQYPVQILMLEVMRQLAAGNYASAVKAATKALASDSNEERVALQLMDLRLEAMYRQGSYGKQVLRDESTRVLDKFRKFWSIGLVSPIAIGWMQESYSNPSTRIALIQKQLGDDRDAFVTLDSGRAWSILRKSTRAEDIQRLAQKLTFEDYQSWAKSLPTGTVALTFAITPERKPCIFALTGQKLVFSELKLSQPKLKALVTSWLKDLKTPSPNPKREQETAAQIYDACLREVLSKVGPSINRLIVVPDGVLQGIPFSALVVDGKKRRLIDDVRITIAPALHILEKDRNREPKKTRRGFFGCPSEYVGSNNLDRLDGFSDVMSHLAERYQASSWSADKFTAGAVKTNLPSLTEIAFFTHGIISEDDPLNSYLIVNGKDPLSSRLTVREIVDLNLDAEMVAVWACRSASGPMAGGDGLIGLAWSFISSGARSVVASKWEIDVAATALLARTFYDQLYNRGLEKDTALRNAIHILRSDPLYQHPHYWAAFDLFGDNCKLTR